MSLTTEKGEDTGSSCSADLQTQEALSGEKVGLIRQIIRGLSTPRPADLDSKTISERVRTIALPAMIESFLLHLASMVNTMMVGSIGTWAIAAIGYCTQPRFLLLAVFQAFNTGSTALIARAKGANDIKEANNIMHQSILLSVLASLALAVLGYIFATPMVVFMGAQTPQTILGATQYMRVIMLSFPANALSLAITAVLRGIGKTRVAMVYNISSNVVNVIIGFLFITGRFGLPRLEVMGAALGMACGQIVGMIIAVYAVVRGADILHFDLKSLFRLSKATLARVTKIGAPAMLDQGAMRVGQLMFAKVVASLGTEAYATHQIVNNILSLTFANGMAFGVAATALLGQSMGYKRPDHGKAYVQICRRYSMIISLGLAAFMTIFGRFLVGMYTTEADVITQGAALLWIVALVQPLQSSQQVLAGALRGAGDTKAVAFCTFLGLVLVRPILSYTLVNIANSGLWGVWIAMICDQAMRSCYTMWRFASDKWKTIKV
ncbi:MAG: MATE family efflux transporter [Christensenellales bacterium]